jgi:chromosome segregation ATPase
MVQLIKQLNETEDQRKALLDQVQSLKKQARERDDNLQHASYELEESSKQFKRTREELRQWQGEMDEMRERMKKLEEMRTVLKPLIDEILRHLENDKDGPKLSRSPSPAK